MKCHNNLTDQQLIHSFLEGDVEAFSAIVNRHRNRIFTSICLLVKDKYLAEDIFQEVFIRIIEKLKKGRYTDEGKFLPWAIRIAHNMCVDHFRKIKRCPAIKTSDGLNLFNDPVHAAPAADYNLLNGQRQLGVKQMLDMLPEDQREVIILRHYGDMSFKEIAGITHCSINTALGRMRYGLINMRRMMTEKQVAF